jgi:hypothetical protein
MICSLKGGCNQLPLLFFCRGKSNKGMLTEEELFDFLHSPAG